jgi:hypothetical protein
MVTPPRVVGQGEEAAAADCMARFIPLAVANDAGAIPTLASAADVMVTGEVFCENAGVKSATRMIIDLRCITKYLRL